MITKFAIDFIREEFKLYQISNWQRVKMKQNESMNGTTYLDVYCCGSIVWRLNEMMLKSKAIDKYKKKLN